MPNGVVRTKQHRNIMTNVDTKEIDKFSEIASRWWDQTSEFKPLHEINPLRLDYINTHAPLEKKRVLDIGCGGGILSESMAKAGAEVTGIDLSEAALEVATLHAMEAGITNVNYECVAFFSTLNRNNKSWLMAIVGAEYILNLLPRGTHEWNRFIKPSELSGWCRNAGLQTQDITGMHYQPLSKTYSTGGNVDVNYMMFTSTP